MAEAGGRVFLITGASSGIGEATARRAAKAGYRLVLAARSTEKLKALAEKLGGVAVTCDVTEWADQAAMVERTLAEYGRLDVAFANAGFGLSRGFKSETPERCSSTSASVPVRMPFRVSCQEARRSAWRLRARWRSARRSC